MGGREKALGMEGWKSQWLGAGNNETVSLRDFFFCEDQRYLSYHGSEEDG